MNSLLVVVLLIIGATAHNFGSSGPSGYGTQRGGPPHGAGQPPHRGGKPFWPHRPPPGSNVKCGKLLNSNDTRNLNFTVVFQAVNVTLQNANTTLPIPEGESTFILPYAPKGPPRKDGRKPPEGLRSYVKIICKSNSTTPLSFEYGVAQGPQSSMMFGSDSHEYWPQ